MTTNREELKRLALAATPGPWRFVRHTGDLDGTHSASDDWTVYGPPEGVKPQSICFEGSAPKLADPEYIAAVNPAVVLSLLADLERAEAELKKTRDQEPVMFAYQWSDGSWHNASATMHSAGMKCLYAAPVAQQGRKLVPVEPTQPMRDAGNKTLDMLKIEPGMGIADRAFYAYKAMIAAAPEAV